MHDEDAECDTWRITTGDVTRIGFGRRLYAKGIVGFPRKDCWSWTNYPENSLELLKIGD